VLPSTAQQFQTINSSLGNGVVNPTSDPNVNTLSFQWANKITTHYPAIRVDHTATDNTRFSFTYSQQKSENHNRYNEQFPGVDPVNLTSSRVNNRIAGFGYDWVVRPTLINQFHAGYMYQYSVFSPENLGLDLPNIFRQNWGYGLSLYGNSYPRRPISSFYPLLNATDTVTWQKDAHTLIFGGSWYREQDHYWNGPGGEPNYTFAIVNQDPLSAVFASAMAGAPNVSLTDAQDLYALLTGRVSAVSIGVGRPLDPATKQYKPFGAYNLNEVVKAAGFWAQDRWRIRPDFTLNYGIRWDIVADNYDRSGAYSNPPTMGDLWGPTPVGAMFAPGVLGGVQSPVFEARQHVYKTSWVNPQPAVALAWNPRFNEGFLGKLFGDGKTVIRTGYSLRNYTEGAQNYWAFASNSGRFFFQQGGLTADPTQALGNFAPGSLTFGDPLPPYKLTPAEYATTVPQSAMTFTTNSFFGMNPDIRQPYVQQWNFGIQRQLGGNNVLEVRYVGNLSLHQWLGYDLNEVNIFENGFIEEFQAAQRNLQINEANGRGATFAYNGLPGQSPLAMMQAAFGSPTASNFRSGGFITNLRNGEAGLMARTMARDTGMFCRMVGMDAFGPCAERNSGGAGAGYPINYWQVNPYATGRSLWYLDAAGHSNYHAMQVELRQKPTYGMQFNVNYTLAKSLGVATQNAIQSQGSDIYYTARNFDLNYRPSTFDIRHVFRVSGTYDLPFGRGRAFLNQGSLADHVFGNWTLGTIITMQTGTPGVLGGGFATVNTNQSDSGVVFLSGTAADLQSTIAENRGDRPWVTTFGSQYIASNGAANTTLVAPQTAPGVFGYRPVLYGPGWYNVDLSMSKAVQIRESVRFVLQGHFLNALNHPTFNLGNLNVQNLNFGQATSGPTNPRVIELRANIEF
jgi:hypothetical protein